MPLPSTSQNRLRHANIVHRSLDAVHQRPASYRFVRLLRHRANRVDAVGEDATGYGARTFSLRNPLTPIRPAKAFMRVRASGRLAAVCLRSASQPQHL